MLTTTPPTKPTPLGLRPGDDALKLLRYSKSIGWKDPFLYWDRQEADATFQPMVSNVCKSTGWFGIFIKTACYTASIAYISLLDSWTTSERGDLR